MRSHYRVEVEIIARHFAFRCRHCRRRRRRRRHRFFVLFILLVSVTKARSGSPQGGADVHERSLKKKVPRLAKKAVLANPQCAGDGHLS